MSIPRIITDEQEVSLYNSNKLDLAPKDPRFDYNPFRRLSARIIDDFLISIGSLVIIGIFIGLSFLVPVLFILWIILGVLILLTYQTLLKPLLGYYYNQTPGQKVNSLLLTTENGSKPTFIHLLLRSLLEWVNGFFPIHLFSIFSVPIRDDRKSVSDLICSTQVETTKTYPNMVIWSSILGISAFVVPFIITTVALVAIIGFSIANSPPTDYNNYYNSDYNPTLESDFKTDFSTTVQQTTQEI